MIPLKKEKGIVATAAALAYSLIGGAPITSANYHATDATDEIIADGAAARLDVANYTAPDVQNGGFTAQVPWVGVENSSYAARDYWCEIGWTKGWTDGNQHDGNYRQYAAFRTHADGYEEFLLYYGIEVGRSYHYEIVRQYDGDYRLYIDLNHVGDCYADPFTLWVQTGLEYTSPDATANAVDPRELQIRRPTDLRWFYWGEVGNIEPPQIVGSRSRWQWQTYPTHGRDWIQ